MLFVEQPNYSGSVKSWQCLSASPPVLTPSPPELPDTSFTRSISNPEAVMRRRRQQKLEKKLQQFRSKDGAPDTGGTLKVGGKGRPTLRPGLSDHPLTLSHYHPATLSPYHPPSRLLHPLIFSPSP